MNDRVLERVQLVPRPLDEVFAFFDKPEHLALLTPPDLGFRLTGQAPQMRLGTAIDYTLAVFGARLRWRSRIAAYNPPFSFCDVQESGPYSSWTHIHRFEPASGGTRVTDEVFYELPCWPLGELAAPFVRRELERIFDFRRDAVAALFSGPSRPGGVVMKIVVAGVTGFIGRALTAALRARGDDVVPLGRTSTPADYARAVEGAGAVINLAGENIAAGRWSSSRKKAILESRTGVTRSLVDAIAAAQAKPKVLVNASAVGFYGISPEGEVDEASPKGDGFLADVCDAWEREAVRAEAFGVRVARVRFGVVLGRGGGALPKMALPFRFFAGGRVGSGRQPMPWVHLDDAVGVLLYAVDSGLSGPVNAVAGAPDEAEFAKALGRALHRPSWAPAPSFAMKLALGEMSSMLLGGQRAKPARLLSSGYHFKRPDLDDALARSV